MSENQAEHAVSTMCRALGVTEAGYYAWRGRAASKRAEEDAHLSERIHAIHQMSDGTYGTPRVRAELVDTNGLQVGRRRVARLMREARLVGVSRRGYRVTTKRDDAAQPAADLVERRFEARGPNEHTSLSFGQRCRQAGVRPSMGSVGDAYDNALCESFFASLECELLDRRAFRTHAAARMAVFQYIAGWHNLRRRHSALGYQSPANDEKRYRTAA